ncbi:Methyltransferase domain-containing protein [Bizionia echini]|uniref:Methyltransferase domain-containing protein n=1 Tax=Bizionia echini TaxID=649333 RepID=A0A1I5BCL6_9FLAO|nr:class I SAM-dependent methyltransferase [Bizionia echini]SFN72464.1 Methyltransferase domain-containing protein [Bizionia echini]
MSKKAFLGVKRVIKRIVKSKQEIRHSLVGAPNVWKYTRDFQFQFLKEQGLQKTDTFLDIGCGTLRGGIPLIDYLVTGNYYGMDVRDEVLKEGKDEIRTAKLEGKKPNLIAFNHFSEVEFDVTFNVMFAFSVLIHLEDAIAESCFQFVSKYLAADGEFYANVNLADFKDGTWLEFPIVFRSLEFYNTLAAKNGMKVDVLGDLLSLGHDTGKNSDKQQVMLKFTKI